MKHILDALEERRAGAKLGGGEKRIEAQHARGKLTARERVEKLLDPGSFQELDTELTPQDPLGFVDAKKYRDRLKSTFKNTGMRDAFISGVGAIGGKQVSIGSFAFEFMGGSMGSVVGEKVARVFDRAFERRIPAIVLSSTGGARRGRNPTRVTSAATERSTSATSRARTSTPR